MPDLNRRLPHVRADRYSMIPRADIPRSTFICTKTLKTTLTGGYLIPFYLDEVLPGDVHQIHATLFGRLATPVFPVMDNMTMETFFFFVPNRLVWVNWVKMMGEQDNPGDSISFTTPQIVSPAGGFPVIDGAGAGLYDYFGLPTVGQVGGGNTISINALPIRGYALIWDKWFRDENLQNSLGPSTGNGPDTYSNFTLQKRGKAHDYFTSCLPWPEKGGVDVTLPLNGLANIKGIGTFAAATGSGGSSAALKESGGTGTVNYAHFKGPENAGTYAIQLDQEAAGARPIIQADLSTATGATINALRLAFQTQRLLERDARGGTRYTELLRSHFGVLPQDSRLQRPEYIGGGRSAIQTSAIPQTSATGLTGGSSPLGALGAAATLADSHTASYHATEHGFIIGLIHVTADLTYQQGLHKMWTRLTRYDHYWPVFAFLGEQAVLNREIYCDGSANDPLTFGYQERWAEYKHMPSQITGMFRSTTASTIDSWHLSQKFTSLPALNSTFIQDAPPFSRVLAAGAAANAQQILLDTVFKVKRTRAMPMFSVPGNIDRF